MDFLPKEIEQYCLEHSENESDFFKRLTKDTYDKEDVPRMLSGPMVGNLLQLLVRLLNPKLALDIGTFTGYSALKMAEVIQDDGIVKTYDTNERELAKKYIAEAPFGNRVELKIGAALESLAELSDSVDLVFIDADKINYGNYYNCSMELLRQGGVIVLDNMLWNGDVLNPMDKDSRALNAMNLFIRADERVTNQLLPIRDGLMIAQKL
ncbi:MAG: methyltransferase [Candidatus Marinimicrobia bacterium]|jgi:predicted O-methyltransferase YrrM|nr:methyltransferase [Candidatus Neomarinimicrobiota bacterium]MBT3617563.1 methyltransferase [Candidatus Neomarinimicrobiota bacterium]MBT3829240.1 methyltransferase [Candidatus Neomarinimicrobiota bacterium]MBT3996766.1 methyltransferase [Candidatus Neomarinimicrobiota bacterium]MBT4280364.1 methyltransferase [Candidatus Neomarinimicrobiota bacterium]